MAAPSRTAQITRLHKILKKHYTPVLPDPNRSVLEHLLFACCLENAHFRAAEEAFAALTHSFFDWNEIRVSGVRELAEVISGLPDPTAAATRFKRVLQSVFEATYTFDLDDLRKQNLGPAVERLEKTNGSTKFSVAYLVQSALGGHSIPLDSGTLEALCVTNLASADEVTSGIVAGIERAIPKNAGVEFGSLLHQLGADFTATPYASSLQTLLLEIEPGAKERLPNRRAKRPDAESAMPATVPVAARGATPASPAEAVSGAARTAEEKHKKTARKAEGKEAIEARGERAPEASKEPAGETKKKSSKAKASEPAVAHEPPAPAPDDLAKQKAAEKQKAEKSEAGKDKDKGKPPRKDKDIAPVSAAPIEPVVKKTAKKKPDLPKAKTSRPGAASEGLAKRKPR